ncbi:MAG: glycosyltransferase family 9 protein [Candidatus Goldbacteria bacterium]|nr:glycosyltransferase family 9 protein [Candidatus Goldiibacteriota bacterium]
MNENNVKKVLIIKLCCLGDVIQVTPALKNLKNSGCEIHYLCAGFVKPLLELVPFIDKIFTINFKNVFDVFKTLSALNRENYDLVINFHRDLKSFIFAFFVRSKTKAGFEWGKSRFFLSKSFKFDPKIHESERYLSVIRGLGFDVTDKFTHINVPDKPKERIEITGEKKAGIFPGGGENPGTVMYTKRWPIENFVELSVMLIKDGFTVYAFGGAMDKPLIDKLREKVPEIRNAVTAGIQDFVYYVSKMDVFVAPDTGPLHIAAATGIKTIGLFGPSSPELVAPSNGNSVYIKGECNCSPCYVPETVHKKEFLKCRDNVCMKTIKPEMVYKIIKEGEK